MLEKLKTLYGERMVGSKAVSKHDALWFQTDEGETFGVLKSAVTDREKEPLLLPIPAFFRTASSAAD